jgi:hypothetical protein
MDSVLRQLTKRRLIVALAAIAAVSALAYAYAERADSDDPVARYEAAMRADRMGGKTPEETLRLFVAALRADDVELAAAYFMLDDGMSRDVWVDRLRSLQREGMLNRFADDIDENAVPGIPAYDGDYGFVFYDAGGAVDGEIDMEFNSFSGVWKLQSF